MRWLALGVLLVGAPALALADDEATPVAVTATLDGTSARMTARFALDVHAGIGFALQSITLPPGGLVTGGTAIVRGVRRPLRLEEAEVAAQKLDAIAHKPVGESPAWAIEIAGGAANVHVDMLSPIDTKVVLELSVDVPTCFFHAARHALVPDSWRSRLPRAVHGTDSAALDEACAPSSGNDGTSKWVSFPSRHLEGAAQRVGALAGRLPLGNVHVARVELDLAAQLADVPRDLHTAIVIDHSRSLSVDEVEAQRAVVAAYVNLAPLTRVQVIGYARRAQALLPAWMMASQAAPRLDRAIRALAPRNGSNIDAGLAEAASWLSRVKGTKRIVLFTDERLSERLGLDPVATLRRVIPAGTLVHVVIPSNGDGKAMRAEETLLDGLAKATEGIAIHAGVGELGEVDPTILLRPTSLDKIVIKAPGWKVLELFDESRCQERESLDAGLACTWWGTGNATEGPITVEGLLWNHRFVRTLRPDPSQARTLARLLSAAGGLEEPLQQQVDRAALAVNAVWSLFATWGGNGGYEDLGAGGGSITGGGFSGGGSHTIGHGFSTGTAARIDVRAQLEPAIRRCRRENESIAVTLELTREEIVDVVVDVDDAAVRTCVTEALWDTTLLVANAREHTFVQESF